MNKLRKWLLGKEVVSQLQEKALVTAGDDWRRGGSFMIANGTMISSEDNKKSYLTNGLLINDIVYSIIRAICDKIKLAQWNVYKVTDESSLKQLWALKAKKDWSINDYQTALKLQSKAMKPVNAGKLNEILEYPNEYCGFNDLVADSSLFKMTTGGRLIRGTRLDGGANAGKVQYLEHLPYQIVTILASNTWPMREMYYEILEFGLTGEQKRFSADDVMHDKYFNPDWSTTGSHLYGLSPLKPSLKLIDKSNSSSKAATASFQNGGPKGVVFFKDERLTDARTTEKNVNELKRVLYGKEYTGPDNNNKTAITGYEMGYEAIGANPADLQLIESDKADLRRFCNVFGAAPSQIFNDPENKVYNNTKEGEKAFTSRCALPLMNDFRSAFIRQLEKWGLGKRGDGVIIDYDITCYSELQEDLDKKWTWVRELPVPWEYKLELMGMDIPQGHPELKEIMIPSGFQPIDAINEVDNNITGQDAED